MPQPIFALIFPLSGDGGLTPGYPLPGGPPGHPSQGLPGYGHPDQGLPGYGHPGQGLPSYGHPDQGLPGHGHPSHPIIIPPDAIGPGVPSRPIFIDPGFGVGRPDRPNQGLPGGGNYPSQGLPGQDGRPDRPSHELPGMGGHPWLPGYGNRPGVKPPIVYPPGFPDQGLPPTPGLPPLAPSHPIVGVPDRGQLPVDPGYGQEGGLPEGSVVLIPVPMNLNKPMPIPTEVPPGSKLYLAWGGPGTLPQVVWIAPKPQPK